MGLASLVFVALRVLFLYFVIRLLWSLVFPRPSAGGRESPSGRTRRFDAAGHDIRDGEFEDVE